MAFNSELRLAKFNATHLSFQINPELWQQFSYKLNSLKNYLLSLDNIDVFFYKNSNFLTKTTAKIIDDSNYILGCNDLIALKLHNPKLNLRLSLQFNNLIKIESLEEISSITVKIPVNSSDILDISTMLIKKNLFINNQIVLFNLYEGYSKINSLSHFVSDYSLYENKYSNMQIYDVLKLWKNNIEYESFLNIHETSIYFNRQTNKLVYEHDIIENLEKKNKIFIKGLWYQNIPHNTKVKIIPVGLVIQGAKYKPQDIYESYEHYITEDISTVIGTLKGFFDLNLKKWHNYIYLLEYIFKNSNKQILVSEIKNQTQNFQYSEHNKTITIFISHRELRPFIDYFAQLLREFWYKNIPYHINVNIKVTET